MKMHLSARLAWHMDGWNGRVCRVPGANSYCIGAHSYPGTNILKERRLEIETVHAGKPIEAVPNYIPPCIYSANAFGATELEAYSNPPDFFFEGAKRVQWKLPPATVCVWPYEEMYRPEVESGNGYDNDSRRERAREYFTQFEPDQSLIFYYANYSNPFSEDEASRYVIVGVSSLKAIGPELFYRQVNDRVREKYAGGFVWQRGVTSHYPEVGFRLPYHQYMDKPEALERMLVVPENARNFKYATRAFGDDEALGLIEHLINAAEYLRDSGDKNEDWSARLKWLQAQTGRLWTRRGLYPGLGAVLEVLDFPSAIPIAKKLIDSGEPTETVRKSLFEFLEGGNEPEWARDMHPTDQTALRRKWKLQDDGQQKLLAEVLPRFDLATDQVKSILSDKRDESGIVAPLKDVARNPYILSEQYVGVGADDAISFSKIDRGVLPAPNLGGKPLHKADAPERLRALLVNGLRREDKHTFAPISRLLAMANAWLENLPEQRQHIFNDRYISADKEFLEKALTLRIYDDVTYAYLTQSYQDEREIERLMRDLAGRQDISFKSPVTVDHWRDFLYNTDSPIAKSDPQAYDQAIQGQIDQCQKVFNRPIAVICGTAGTGKTTAIRAVIKAIEKAHGAGTAFKLLAPTGKAADRLRTATGKPASTVHSFLAEKGWLNDNFTFKPTGGKRATEFNTFIIDEASMLDLALFATLIRAIDWNSVQRLILVGDPNQLPPIGMGRMFADVIDWLRGAQTNSIGELTINIRQMENRLRDRGTGILDLASLYVRRGAAPRDAEEDKADAEEMLKRVQDGGNVDKDLRVVFWTGQQDLQKKLIDTITADMEADTGKKANPERPYELWDEAFKVPGEQYLKRAEYAQVISPYRGDVFGTENLNTTLQRQLRGKLLERIGTIDGITLFDKVMQIRNRGRSNTLYAYNIGTRKGEPIEVFNGELGFARPHGFDNSEWQQNRFWFRRFQVEFTGKEGRWVNYGRDLGKSAKGFEIVEGVGDNLELAYAISVHKSQGSEFGRVYFVVPKRKQALLTTELFYTGLTRAQKHCTLLIEEDISPLLSMRRPERSQLLGINSSLFGFKPIPEAMLDMREWYEEGKVHVALTEILVRSKSEVIIANLLTDRQLAFAYEVPLYATDGSFYLPDFTVTYQGERFFWEHLGMLDQQKYRDRWEKKRAWYEQFFPGQLITTEESGRLSMDAERVIRERFPGQGSIIAGPSISPHQEILDLIKKGESATLEFKSTARWDIRQNQINKAMEQVIIKTVAAFLNSGGGTLLIGVDDKGNPLGLENDYQTLGKKQDRDGYENWLVGLLLDKFGKDIIVALTISLVDMDGKDVCRVEAKGASHAVYVEEGNDEKLYVRTGNSSRPLTSRETVGYVKDHWG